MLRFFAPSLGLTVAAVGAAYYFLGIPGAITTIILIMIEVAFSFDNAVINAKVLDRLSRFWQQLFLTVGMLIAIVGMRFIFPILIVVITAGQSWDAVIDDALHNPDEYAKHLAEAHPLISSFGGAFLMTLTAYFFLDKARKDYWLDRTEKFIQKFAFNVWLPPILVALLILVIGLFAGEEQAEVWQAGFAGVILYTILKFTVDALGRFADLGGTKKLTGWAAFGAFMYLEVLDASFSFDGVLGAFAITDKVLIIALGLGVGALWVRSMTIYMVRHGVLKAYKYLEHGAHYAIFFLAMALLLGIFIHVPEAITGFVGIGIIVASFISSVEARKAHKKGNLLN